MEKVENEGIVEVQRLSFPRSPLVMERIRSLIERYPFRFRREGDVVREAVARAVTTGELPTRIIPAPAGPYTTIMANAAHCAALRAHARAISAPMTHLVLTIIHDQLPHIEENAAAFAATHDVAEASS